MNAIHEDYNTHIGKLEIPCYEAVGGAFKFADIITDYRFDPRAVKMVIYEDKEEPALRLATEELDIFRYNGVKKKLNEAREKGRIMTNGLQVGLKDWMLHDEDSAAPRLELYLNPSHFFDHAGLNVGVDVPELSDGDGGKTTIRQKYLKDPTSFRDILPNSIGVNVLPITSDGYIILMNRGGKNLQYPDSIGVGAAGFMVRELDRIDGVPNPFKTAERECMLEAGISANVNDFELIGLARPVTGKTGDLHAEVNNILRTNMTYKEVLEADKKEKYEGKHFAVPFTVEGVLSYAVQAEKWVPAHNLLAVRALESEFGKDAVAQGLKKLGL